MQNLITSQLCTDDKNQNILAILRAFSNLKKVFMEKLYTMETTPKATTTAFLKQILNRHKISNKQLNPCDEKMSSDENKKSINSQIDDEYPGNYGLTAKFYIHFSNELASGF